MCWMYGKKCMERQPKDAAGFVYKIIASDSKDLPEEIRGKIYIGKKLFSYTKKRKLSLKKKKELQTRKKSEKVLIDSKWLQYWGSSKELLADIAAYGEENFERKVLHICYTKPQCNYYEAMEIIKNKVLMPYTNSYNKWLSVKVFKNSYLQDIELLK